ncbi:MAG TPA: MarR family transcriptional regulator [Miltoncostaeaceae bacterium]|nr:MarR family transcriptional regulator [Miltoncostaeaceae bacterium]
MDSPVSEVPSAERLAAVETIARELLPRTSLIARLLLRHGTTGLSRAEAGVLSALAEGPMRVTELAASQGLAQPTVTQLTGRLERRGLVERGRDAADGRVVLVSATPAGRAALEALRREYRALLRDHLAGHPDEDVLALAAAIELIREIIEALQRDLP